MERTTLLAQYRDQAIPALKAKFGYANVMQVPKLDKVVVNVGYGRHVKEKSYVEHVEKVLAAITGQKPIHHRARKSISNFKIRLGQPVGVSVTLRGKSMYEFVFKLIHLTLPRVRDFRGLPKTSCDPQGNYTIGFKEQLPFPEVTAEMSDIVHGLEVTIVTTAKSKEEGLALLQALGLPLREK